MERTFLMIKPDGVRRKLIGQVVSRFEKRGFNLVGAKLIRIDRELAEIHYAEHRGKAFFEDLIDFITSGPVFAFALEGEHVVEVSRKMMGATSPLESLPGTVRGDFTLSKSENIIHGSDSIESAARELALFFNDDEFV